jgi:hypothetical protein
MFGHRFFGARYFGPRYFGPAGDVGGLLAVRRFLIGPHLAGDPDVRAQLEGGVSI